MQKLKSMPISCLSAIKQAFRQPSQSPVPPVAQSGERDRYVDGYAYRKVASPSQVISAIQEFFQEFLGREASPDDMAAYLQQWHDGRSLRSIRDEIANCLESQRWSW